MQQLRRLRWCSDYGDRVAAAIAVMAASAQRLRQWRHWRSDCGGGVGCGSVGVGWRSDSGDSGILAVVAAMALVGHRDYGGGNGIGAGSVAAAASAAIAVAAVAAAAQRLRWRRQPQRSDCVSAAIAAAVAAQ